MTHSLDFGLSVTWGILLFMAFTAMVHGLPEWATVWIELSFIPLLMKGILILKEQ